MKPADEIEIDSLIGGLRHRKAHKRIQAAGLEAERDEMHRARLLDQEKTIPLADEMAVFEKREVVFGFKPFVRRAQIEDQLDAAVGDENLFGWKGILWRFHEPEA